MISMKAPIQFIRGSTDKNNSYTGAEGSLSIDMDKWTIRVHDGKTPGGHEVTGSGTSPNVVTLDTLQTITGEKIFSTLPKSTKVPTLDEELVPKSYVDHILEYGELPQVDGSPDSNQGGSILSYVIKPKITSPTNGSTNHSIQLTIRGNNYENLIQSDTRKHREFQVSKDPRFHTDLVTKLVNSDEVTLDQSLDKGTDYYIRIRDISSRDYRSFYSSVVKITTIKDS